MGFPLCLPNSFTIDAFILKTSKFDAPFLSPAEKFAMLHRDFWWSPGQPDQLRANQRLYGRLREQKPEGPRILTVGPIEFVHRWELPGESHRGWHSTQIVCVHALRGARCEDPDVILVSGELRDLETIRHTMRRQHRSHPGLQTLHWRGKTVDRIIDVFPSSKNQIRVFSEGLLRSSRKICSVDRKLRRAGNRLHHSDLREAFAKSSDPRHDSRWSWAINRWTTPSWAHQNGNGFLSGGLTINASRYFRP